MGVLCIYLICVLDFHLFFTVYSCTTDEFTIVNDSGNVVSCQKCPTCRPGEGLSPQCGSNVKETDMNIACKPCELGKSFSATNDIGSCHSCEICSEHQTVVRNCTLVSNSKCYESCSSGYYFEKNTEDCQPCSWCCSGEKDSVKDECKDMPFYKQCDAIATVNRNADCKPKCKKDQYIVVTKNGGHCEDCKSCPPGSSPFPKCGSILESTAEIKCLGCVTGQTYSDQWTGSCKACSECSVGQKELIPCNLTNDRVCGECDKGFYKDDSHSECKPCSACCNDDKDIHVQKCAEQNIPENLQCSYTQRAISVCQQRRNMNIGQESKSYLVVYIASGVAVGLVISVLAMLYWRLKYRRYNSLSSHHSQELLLQPSEQEEMSHAAKLEDPTVNGSQETLSFEKCGVLLQFNDPQSFFDDAQQIRVEICWDQTACHALQQDEVQLSPVIKFHPPGLKLSKPVQIRIPHSALVFYTNGWNLKLKSLTLQNGTTVWKNEEMDEIGDNEVCFRVDCLLSYVVVGTSMDNSKQTKKRFQCAVFGGEGKVGENYTAYLYVFDDCEASLEKIMEVEKSNNRILLGSLQSVYVESVLDADITISIKQPVEGWKSHHINPPVITHKSLKESYQTIPMSQILFEHDNGRNRDFHCTFELTADKTTTKISAVASIKDDPFRRFQESHTGLSHNDCSDCMVTGRNLCNPLITNHDKPSTCIHELPKEVLHAACMKLDQPLKGVGNWRHIAAKLGFTDKEVDVFREEMLTADGSPCTVMLKALQTKNPELTVAEFVQILQTRKIQRFDVVNVLEPYVYDLISNSREV